MLKIGRPVIPTLLEALYNKSLYDFVLRALRGFSKDQLAFELYLKSLQNKRQRDRAIYLAKKLDLLDVELQLRNRMPQKQYIPMIINKLASLSNSMDYFEMLPQKVIGLLQRILLENQTRVLQ
ncbi:MAG: hypothetical protein IPO36_09715 [Anaerolineales bacterium]|nr:hypothetical protein [Anaerolineales bacterium]